MEKILDCIESPRDLRSLTMDELNILCREIRQEIIRTVAKNGGHLASNLGVVELTALRAGFRATQTPKRATATRFIRATAAPPFRSLWGWPMQKIYTMTPAAWLR